MLTQEQSAAIDAANSGFYQDVKINAFAGAGKTTTLKAIAENRNDKGLYIAFNKAIQVEASEKFPKNVTAKTGHSLAFRDFGRQYANRLGNINASIVLNYFDVNRNDFHSASGLCYLAINTVRRFLYTSDPTIDHNHLPALKDEGNTLNTVLMLAKEIYKEMLKPDSDMPVSHDFYLKQWALSEPDLDYSFILFDEAQDANPIILDLIQKQTAQKIYVGDKYQQIYSWRGAINAMDEIKSEHDLSLTQSFRFGNCIADSANKIISHYLKDKVNIKGFDKVSSSLCEVSHPTAKLFRTNSMMIDSILSNTNIKPYVVGGVNELVNLVEGCEQIYNGRRSYNAELMFFKNWDEVKEYSNDPSGRHLKLVVRYVEEDRVTSVINGLNRIKYNKKSNSDVILSTCHKAKGLEFESVFIADDFTNKNKEDGFLGPPFQLEEEDARLLYVACTRAINHLDVTQNRAYQEIVKNGY